MLFTLLLGTSSLITSLTFAQDLNSKEAVQSHVKENIESILNHPSNVKCQITKNLLSFSCPNTLKMEKKVLSKLKTQLTSRSCIPTMFCRNAWIHLLNHELEVSYYRQFQWKYWSWNYPGRNLVVFTNKSLRTLVQKI